MRPLSWSTLPWVLCVAAAALAASRMFATAGRDAQEQPVTLEQEIADIERQIDAIEADAIAGIPSLLAGSPERLPALGKILFFDKELSVNRNEACAFCHMPQTGYQGAIQSINLGGVAQPGSVRTRFSFRKPPQSASPGPLGGARVQYDLRRAMVFLDAFTLNKPEIFIGNCASKLDEKTGEISDETTRNFVKQQLVTFAKFISQLHVQG